ncbi:hypothetical protein [Jatrophihabitans sp.]|jgi:hypothetical protein|uniref:hypothetical protein n=1 Tax=Jatrophihabitans sp. TaxID=1932789 RepID=UPI002EE5C2E6
MRTFLSSAVAACAAALVLAPAAASADPAPQLRITHNTSAIYQFDPSPNGDGVLFDTVQVTAELRHCPAGDYLRSITLVQDGVSYPWAVQALGAVEVICPASGVTGAGMSFFGNGLHPGTAVVTITITSETDGSVLAQDSRTVRIPAGDNQP